MDKLQQYYESLPLCTGNTPGNVMFSVYNDIDNLDSLTRWFDLPDDEAYNKVPNLTFQRTGLPTHSRGIRVLPSCFSKIGRAMIHFSESTGQRSGKCI